jgi:Tat protein translocase TatB subunit
MFDVGFAELVLLFMLGLIVLGPEKLPRIAAQIGRWVGRARRTATQLRYQLEREINLDEHPRRPYTPPPKTSQIVPPPGAQRDGAAGDQDAAADAGEPAAASGGGTDESDRDSGT